MTTDYGSNPWSGSEASDTDEDSDVSEYQLEEESDIEVLHFAADAPEPIQRMVTHLCRNYEAAFPEVDGKRYMHPFFFEMMLDQLRQMFLHYRRVKQPQDAAAAVKERPTYGSLFQPDGSYIMADGTVVGKQLRDEVNNLRILYRESQQIQQRYRECNADQEVTRQQMRAAAWHYHARHTIPTGPLPVWEGKTLAGQKVHARGHIRLTFLGQRTVIRPQNIHTGPLYWEVSLEAPKETSGKDTTLPAGATAESSHTLQLQHQHTQSLEQNVSSTENERVQW